MPIICKIQLDATKYKNELDNVLKLTEKAQADVAGHATGAARTIEAAADQAVKAAQKAAKAPAEIAKPIDMTRDALKDAVASMEKNLSSSPASGFVDRLKNAFSGLTSSISDTGMTLKMAMGKVLGFGSQIAIIAAGIASVVKIVKTLAIDNPLQKLQDRAKDAAASFDSLKSAAAAAETYRSKTDAAAQALAEFASKDKLSNLEKEKAVRLIKEMNQGYGNLGVSISEATGKLEGYTNALIKKLNADRERRLQENTSQQESARQAIEYYDEIIKSNWANDAGVTNTAQTEKMKYQKELEDLIAKRGELLRSDPVGDYLAERGAQAAGKQRDVEKSEKQFAQNREFAGMSREEKADALRKSIAEEQGKLDSLGDTLQYHEHIASQKGSTDTGKAKVLAANEKAIATREEILKSRQRLSDLQKQLDAFDAEDQNRRDEADDAYASGLTPVERAELLRSRLAAARKDVSGYRKELSDLDKPGYHGAADEERKLAIKEKIVQSEERIQNLTKRVAEAEAEAIRVEQEAQERVNSFLDAKTQDLEIARLEAAAEYEKADALRLQNELQAQNLSLSEKELETAKELAKERNAAALKSSLKDQSLDLLDAAKRKAGLDEEADTDRAIREAEKTKRGKLSAEEEDYVRKLTQLSRAVSGQEENPLSYTSDLSVRTNELTARGGFASGAVMPSVEQVNKNILSEIKNARDLLSRIQETVEEGLTT